MTALLAAWQAYLDNLPVDAALPRVILESWGRSHAANVDPHGDPVPFRRVEPQDLERRLSENAEMIRAARAHLAWLTAVMASVRHVVYLVDRDGIVLETKGNAPDLIEVCGLLPGHDWSEATMGTNGAGTALASGQAVAVVGPMHFCRAWHDATCMAAPIHGPDGRVIGAVDLTTSVADGSPDRLPLVAHLAYAVELELARSQARQRVDRLNQLAHAAVAISGTLSLEAVLDLITEQAREIIGAHVASTGQTIDERWGQRICAVSLSPERRAWEASEATRDASGLYALVCRENRSMRLTQAELEAHPTWRGVARETATAVPLRGWLAAPLVDREGRNLGLIQLSDKYQGDFTEDDEATLVQLAKLAAVAIENARLYRQAQDAVRHREAFLARASHELRTPLTSLVGMIRMLERVVAGTLDESPATLVHIARRNADALLALVNNLLDASKLTGVEDTLERERVDLADVLRRSIELVSPQAREKSVPIRTSLPAGLRVQGDALRLEQLFVNLLANAVKFTPEQGEVVVEAEARGEDAIVRVRDTGQGIAHEHLERIFEPFFQGHGHGRRRNRGTGLGLAICRQIVTLHGGRLWAESDGPRRGSCFTVVLPALVPEVIQAA